MDADGLYEAMASLFYAKARPEVAARFLAVYLRAADFVRAQPADSLVADYQRFCASFGSRKCDAALARNDLKEHPLFSLPEQLSLFTSINSDPSLARKWMMDMAAFSHTVGQITDKELEQVKNAEYVTDRYLRLIDPATLKVTGDPAK